MQRSHLIRWVVGVASALAVVALLIWADRQSGIDDRDTDPADVEVTSYAPLEASVIGVGEA